MALVGLGCCRSSAALLTLKPWQAKATAGTGDFQADFVRTVSDLDAGHQQLGIRRDCASQVRVENSPRRLCTVDDGELLEAESAPFRGSCRRRDGFGHGRDAVVEIEEVAGATAYCLAPSTSSLAPKTPSKSWNFSDSKSKTRWSAGRAPFDNGELNVNRAPSTWCGLRST